MATNHAAIRSQQRCIPPVVDQWLDDFGEEQYDGHGAIKRYFGRNSVAKMKREFGAQFVRHNLKWLRAYRVEDASNGTKITCGWLHQRVRRR